MIRAGNGGTVIVERSQAGRDINIYYYNAPPTGTDATKGRQGDRGTATSPAVEGKVVAASSRVLVVCVHGLHGSSEQTWEPLKKTLQTVIKEPYSLFDFGYPAKLWNAASIHAAARDLLAVLGKLPAFEHYVFVCHSAGGLVVKEAVLHDLCGVVREEVTCWKPTLGWNDETPLVFFGVRGWRDGF